MKNNTVRTKRHLMAIDEKKYGKRTGTSSKNDFQMVAGSTKY